jgi:hypothetical protein
MEILDYTQKLRKPRISKSEKGHNYAKKQIRVMGLVPIMLDNHREQVCEISIHSL